MSDVPKPKVSIHGPIGRLVSRATAGPTFARIAPKVVAPLDVLVHRLTGGRHIVSEGLVPTVVLTTIGAKSGEPRTVPLACLPDHDDFYVVGSNFGRDHHPAWTTNLLASPRATASYRGESFEVVATLLDADAKAAVWPRLVAIWPNYDAYTERSGRDLRVFHLVRHRI